jgi:hypothetical protein
MIFVAVATALATQVCVLLPVGSAVGAGTIRKRVNLFVKPSITRDAAGDITVRFVWKSPDPRCLAKESLENTNELGGDGYWRFAGGFLYFGGSEKLSANPPDNGWLDPVTPFGKSELVWEEVYPAGGIVLVEKGEESYKAPISAATGIYFYFEAGSGYTYRENGHKVLVGCVPPGHGRNGGPHYRVQMEQSY